MKIYRFIWSALLLLLQYSCSDYLDVVPDNVQTLDIVFNNKVSAEKYLTTCYSFVPNYGSMYDNPALAAGHETWLFTDQDRYFSNTSSFGIALGRQNISNPHNNYWGGEMGAKPLYRAIRECNVFLEYVSDYERVTDLTNSERLRWLAEAKVLKAYYHYFLLQLYGPIPIVDENIPVMATPEEVKVVREPVDDVVKYIVDQIDEAYRDLPPRIMREATEMGRLTQPAALAIKAKTLLLAASPLFNGNTNYANFKNQDGVHFISQQVDRNKWKLAADATLAAIESATTGGHVLYDFKQDQPTPLPDALLYSMNVRQAVTERFNKELIWSIGKQNTNDIQRNSMACLIPATRDIRTSVLQWCARAIYAPTLETAERFYSSNGVPINEDTEWASKGYYSNRYGTETVPSSEKYNLKSGFTTATLNFRREPRFYGSLGFDGSTWYGNGWTYPDNDSEKNYVDGKKGRHSGNKWSSMYSITGYFAKKLVYFKNEITDNQQTIWEYPFPIIRFADLYLMYAEALNEAGESEDVNPLVYDYLRLVRERSGLKAGLFGQTEDIGDVRVAWAKYSINPNKALSKSGMREIIKQERQIELALEGQQYYDLRRWKDAAREFSKPVKGWNIMGATEADYYKVTVIHYPKAFANKDYLWPVKEHDILINNSLIQTYGW